MSLFRPEVTRVKTLVVKLGSRILATTSNAARPENRIRQLSKDIARLYSTGISVIVVSSGAIAQGMLALGLDKRPATVPMQQACASIGQVRLMALYEKALRKHGIPVGQVLLSWDDFRNKLRYLNLRNTLFTLLRSKAVPVVNENDSVGVEEIKFGDNDALSGQIALLANADLYVNLTSVNGLYTGRPDQPGAERIPVVERIDKHMIEQAGSTNSELSVGGMLTKLRAADMVTRSGIPALIGNGFDHGLLEVLLNPEIATFFPAQKRMRERHRFIAFTGKSRGELHIDTGAAQALTSNGKSLLAAGIRGIVGQFEPGDQVDIIAHDESLVAKGIVNYSSSEINTIKGLRTDQIVAMLKSSSYGEVVHRDNMVICT